MTATATTNRRKLLGNNGLVVVKAQSPLDKIGLNSDIWKRFKQTFAIEGKEIKVEPEDLSKTPEEIQENITNALDALKELKTGELNIKKDFSELDSKYAEFVGWANQFETASLEVQRMIVNKMVKEISIGKGIDGEYEVKILLRGTYNQFINPEYAVA